MSSSIQIARPDGAGTVHISFDELVTDDELRAVAGALVRLHGTKATITRTRTVTKIENTTTLVTPCSVIEDVTFTDV